MGGKRCSLCLSRSFPGSGLARPRAGGLPTTVGAPPPGDECKQTESQLSALHAPGACPWGPCDATRSPGALAADGSGPSHAGLGPACAEERHPASWTRRGALAFHRDSALRGYYLTPAGIRKNQSRFLQIVCVLCFLRSPTEMVPQPRGMPRDAEPLPGRLGAMKRRRCDRPPSPWVAIRLRVVPSCSEGRIREPAADFHPQACD